jgi:hypothetical protein
MSHVYRLEVDSEHDARDSIVMIFFTSQQFKHLSERDVSKKKSKIDTTIDFVKIPNIQETTPS